MSSAKQNDQLALLDEAKEIKEAKEFLSILDSVAGIDASKIVFRDRYDNEDNETISPTNKKLNLLIKDLTTLGHKASEEYDQYNKDFNNNVWEQKKQNVNKNLSIMKLKLDKINEGLKNGCIKIKNYNEYRAYFGKKVWEQKENPFKYIFKYKKPSLGPKPKKLKYFLLMHKNNIKDQFLSSQNYDKERIHTYAHFIINDLVNIEYDRKKNKTIFTFSVFGEDGNYYNFHNHYKFEIIGDHRNLQKHQKHLVQSFKDIHSSVFIPHQKNKMKIWYEDQEFKKYLYSGQFEKDIKKKFPFINLDSIRSRSLDGFYYESDYESEKSTRIKKGSKIKLEFNYYADGGNTPISLILPTNYIYLDSSSVSRYGSEIHGIKEIILKKEQKKEFQSQVSIIDIFKKFSAIKDYFRESHLQVYPLKNSKEYIYIRKFFDDKNLAICKGEYYTSAKEFYFFNDFDDPFSVVKFTQGENDNILKEENAQLSDEIKEALKQIEQGIVIPEIKTKTKEEIITEVSDPTFFNRFHNLVEKVSLYDIMNKFMQLFANFDGYQRRKRGNFIEFFMYDKLILKCPEANANGIPLANKITFYSYENNKKILTSTIICNKKEEFPLNLNLKPEKDDFRINLKDFKRTISVQSFGKKIYLPSSLDLNQCVIYRDKKNIYIQKNNENILEYNNYYNKWYWNSNIVGKKELAENNRKEFKKDIASSLENVSSKKDFNKDPLEIDWDNGLFETNIFSLGNDNQIKVAIKGIASKEAFMGCKFFELSDQILRKCCFANSEDAISYLNENIENIKKFFNQK